MTPLPPPPRRCYPKMPVHIRNHLLLLHAGQRSRRTVGGLVAPHIPWQVMVYLGDTAFDGGYAGGALISDRWVLTAARNLFVNKTRPPPAYPSDSWEKHSIPKVYVGITDRVLANSSNQAEVEKVRAGGDSFFLPPCRLSVRQAQSTAETGSDIRFILGRSLY